MRNWLSRFIPTIQEESLTVEGYELNQPRDTQYAHGHDILNNVLHVFHLNWHGIRSATGALPGHKLGIHPDKPLSDVAMERVLAFVTDQGISHVVFQAYSIEAAKLAAILRYQFKSNIHISNISHVTASQLKYKFEIDMIEIVNNQIADGILDKRGSVKADVGAFLKNCHSEMIYNCSPNIEINNNIDKKNIAFIPLENISRKNLFTNSISALNSLYIDEVLTVNEPIYLSKILDIAKIKKVNFMMREDLFLTMQQSSVVLNVTFAECQPMTQLEALACGTPCLTGPLNLPVLGQTDLARMTTVAVPDNVSAVTKAIDTVMELVLTDRQTLRRSIVDYRSCALELTIDSYKKFLEFT